MTRPQFAPRRHRAQDRLLAWPSAVPYRRDMWAAVDTLRAEQGHTIPRWPRWCYLPMERAGQIIVDAQVAHGIRPTVAGSLRDSLELSTLAAWRMTQGVYRYDPDLYQALVATSVSGDLPVDVLRRLPEWCVYIETPGLDAPTADGTSLAVYGIWAWLDWLAQGDTTILQIGMDTDRPYIPLANLPLVGTIAESIEAVASQWEANAETIDGIQPVTQGYREHAAQLLPPLVSLVLYLCSDEPDLDGRPTNPEPVRTRHGWRIFPAAGLRRWDVGLRIGAALRAAHAESAGDGSGDGRRRPRAHVRAAHWHGYWTGPRDDEARRRLSVRWLPPTLVNADGEPLPTVIHPVG